MKLITAPRLSVRIAWLTLVTVSLIAVCFTALARDAVAQQPFEAPPVLSAKYLLPPEMISGPLFRVDERVPTDGLRGLFTPPLGPRDLHGARKRPAQNPHRRSCRRSSISTIRARRTSLSRQRATRP